VKKEKVKMIEIKKEYTGFFRAYYDGIATKYSIRIKSSYGGKPFYAVFKDTEQLTNSSLMLSLQKAKRIVTTNVVLDN
jgi:hypothetical protein